MTADYLIRFYDGARPLRLPKAPTLDIRKHTLTNTPTGLGDSVILFDHINAGGLGWNPSPFFRELVKFSPRYKDVQTPEWISAAAACASWDCGPGHHIQRIQRLYGRKVEALPSGNLQGKDDVKYSNRVVVHFEPGYHQAWQARTYHPKARTVYPQNLDTIRRFISLHPELEVFEIGSQPVLGSPAIDFTSKSLLDTIQIMRHASVHIGVLSGPMHVANALGVRTIAIINFPSPWQLMLPNLVYTGAVESEWIYPQTSVLHQDKDSLHWPKFSLASLSAAFDNEVYPYGSSEFAQILVDREEKKAKPRRACR